MDFSSLLNPQAQPPQPQQLPQAPAQPPLAQPTAAPQNPDKRAAWSQLLEDPNMKSALFRMGLQMMQGTRQGESGLAATARAGMGAMDYYGAKNELDRKRASETSKAALDARNVESQIQGRDVQTQSAQQELEQSKTKFMEWTTEADNRKLTADQTVRNLQTQGRFEEARMAKTQFELEEVKRYADFIKANPKLAAEADSAKLKKPILEANQTIAQTGASNASASNSSASAANTRQKTQQEQAVYNAMPPWIQALDADKEAQSYAMANKDVKTQSQIQEDLRNRLHHGFVESKTGAASDLSGYEAQAQSALRMWEADGKRTSLDQFISDNYNVTFGSKGAGEVLKAANRILASQQGATPTAQTPIKMDKVPPIKDRVVGKEYDLPGGTFKWNGRAWTK